MIGITNNPSRYNPYINPEENRERQRIILYQMLDQGYITQAEYDEAIAQELVFTDGSDEAEEAANSYFSYFEDQVINEVVTDLMEKTGYEYQQALQMLQTGGYKIYATIDPEVQQAVDTIYQNLNNIPKRQAVSSWKAPWLSQITEPVTSWPWPAASDRRPAA